jgi:GTP-binding protein
MPGRTQAVNLFELEPGKRLADLPGYGHARVPDAVKATWARLMETYFATRASLSGLLIIVDARRGFGERDEAMLGYATERGIPSRVLLSKSDKLGRNEARQVLATTKALLAGRAGVQLFSATKGEGVDAAQAVLDEMLAGRTKTPGDP